MLTIGKDPETWLVHRVLEQRAAERPDHPVMHWDGQDYTDAAINREANRIVDGMDRPVPPGTSGEIVVRAKHPYILMEGYDGLPEATLAAFRNLWFHSGDRGHMDEEGFLFFHDRMKDAIRRRGENISSFEVEHIVNKHPDVAETAAIAVPAEVGEDEVKVAVVRNPGAALTEEALLRHCAAEMPYFMVPRFIEFRADLPRTPMQKVRKVVLREEGITAATWDREAAGFKVTRDGLARRR